MSIPLPTQSFYRLPDVTVGAATIVGVLDALYSALIQTTDFQSVSVPSTHQWPWTRYQNAGTTEAVYTTGIPGSSALGRTPRIIFAGKASVGSPSMLIDTATNSNLMVGMNLNAGSFNAWDNAAPFTSGPFSGYFRTTATAANSTSTVIRVYVAQELLFVNVIQAAASQYWIIVGACVEPWTNDTTSDADSDNRLYGMFVSGAQTVCNFSLSGGGTNDPFSHGGTNGNGHGTVFVPATVTSGSSGQYTASAMNLFRVAASANNILTSSGAVFNQPVLVGKFNGGNALGRMREIYFFGSKQGGLTYSVSSVNKVHVIATDNSSASNAITLKAA